MGFILVTFALSTLLSILFFRYITYRFAIDRYIEFCITYAHVAKRSKAFLKEVTQVWPMHQIVCDSFIYWRLDRYIVNQDAYNEMISDLEKRALDILVKMEERLKASLDSAVQPPVNPDGSPNTHMNAKNSDDNAKDGKA